MMVDILLSRDGFPSEWVQELQVGVTRPMDTPLCFVNRHILDSSGHQQKLPSFLVKYKHHCHL